jgi:phosphoribosylformimino-5-aminoimidazole carboxamide ribotide isomerase
MAFPGASFPDFAYPRVFPAIDLRRGRCVRLVRGKKDAEIVYASDPLAVARRWAEAGAECLHVIDLGAALGEADSAGVVLAIVKAVDLPVQAGGGLRAEERVAQLLDGGVARVLLSTRVLRDPAFLARMVDRHGPERVVVALDCEGERVKVAGWEEDSALDLDGALGQVCGQGVDQVLITATDRDGTLSGPRIDLVERALVVPRLRVVAAGGVGTLDDVAELIHLGTRRPAGGRLEGVVVGRAFYEGAVELGEAVELSHGIGSRGRRQE